VSPSAPPTRASLPLEIAHGTKSDVTMRELKRLDDRLAAYDVPAAADFREQFAAL
jgi:hypothetical protein